MSREALAQAATEITGVKVFPNFKQTTKPGSGFVRISRTVRAANGFGYINTYDVVICLSQSIETAEAWLDANQDAMCNALSDHAVVMEITPSGLILPEGKKINAVVFECVSGRE